jgi:hypothetical protein
MESGIINLHEIYNFIASTPCSEGALHCNSGLGRSFGKLCTKIARVIPEEKGFYLWGRYDSRKFWSNIYLGKAGFGKIANLRSRILEELKDERCCFWRVAYTEDELMLLKEKHYQERYKKDWERSFLKANTTHIVFVACPEIKEEDVERIESDLIESMNPISNIKRPIPPASLNSDTTKIFNQFRQQIHSNRESGFTIKLQISNHII